MSEAITNYERLTKQIDEICADFKDKIPNYEDLRMSLFQALNGMLNEFKGISEKYKDCYESLLEGHVTLEDLKAIESMDWNFEKVAQWTKENNKRLHFKVFMHLWKESPKDVDKNKEEN